MTNATQPMTLEQAREAERKSEAEYEAETIYDGFSIAEMRQVMDVIQNPSNWRDAWSASVPHDLVRAVMVAVEFFHADKAVIHGIETFTGRVLMSGRGYQAY